MSTHVLTLSRPGSRGNLRVVDHIARDNGRLFCGFVPERMAPEGFTGDLHICRNCQRLYGRICGPQE